jgi:hypothetical protein
MGDRHRAPRRAVIRVTHVGGYGNVWWLHELECGHTERRKRAAPSTHIGCASCKHSERAYAASLARPGVDPALDAQVEIEADRLKAKLASALGVPLDAVGVSVRQGGSALEISGAMVFLHAAAAYEIVKRFDISSTGPYSDNTY